MPNRALYKVSKNIIYHKKYSTYNWQLEDYIFGCPKEKVPKPLDNSASVRL